MTRSTILLLLFLVAAAAFAQPAIDSHGVTNAASYFPYGYHGGGLAQGAMIAIFGRGLGPDKLVQADKYPLAANLGGVSVKITSTGTTVDAIPVYVSARQIGAVVPSRTPIGDATVTVGYNNQIS